MKKHYLLIKKVRIEHNEISKNRKGLQLEPRDIDEGFIFESNGVKVTAFRVNHHDLYSSEPSLGYRIDYNHKSVVISGDTRYCENLIEYSKNVDLLIHEVAAIPLGEDVVDRYKVALNHHTLPEECGKIFSIVKPKLAVYTHIIQFQGVSLGEMMNRTKMEYDGPVIFSED